MNDKLQIHSCESLVYSNSTRVDKIKEIPSTGHNEEQIFCDERNMDKEGDSKVNVKLPAICLNAKT
jgi:hypothetical protein